MAHEHALLAAYLRPPAREGWASIRQRLWRLALRFGAYALILAGLAWGGWHLWYGWQSTDWGAAEHAQALTAQALLTAWWLLSYLRGTRANAQTRALVAI